MFKTMLETCLLYLSNHICNFCPTKLQFNESIPFIGPRLNAVFLQCNRVSLVELMLKLALGLGRYALFLNFKYLSICTSFANNYTGQYHGSCPAFSIITVKCRF